MSSPSSDAATPPRSPDSYADVIADTLRSWIVDGRLMPGEPIRQEAVAQELGASRVPVREALRLLEAEGLVCLQPNRGARVASLDLVECNEIYLMRLALEPVAIEHSAPNLDAAQLAALREQFELMEASDNARTLLEHDRRFHLLTYSAAGLPRLLRAIESLWTSTQPYRQALMAVLSEEEMARVHDVHRLILDALERGDGPDAARLVATHVHRGRMRLASHPELFAGPSSQDGPALRRGGARRGSDTSPASLEAASSPAPGPRKDMEDT